MNVSHKIQIASSYWSMGTFCYCCLKSVIICYQWVLAPRARPCAARTCLFELIATPNGPLPPAPHIAASLILPAIFWGQNYVPVRPTPLIFPIFLFYSFWIFLFVILFFFFSPFQFPLILLFLYFSSYPSLLISSYSSRRYYSSSSFSFPFLLNCLLNYRHAY